MKNIATALVKAQKAFGPALKTSTNPHFKSKYADLAACIEAVMDGLNDNGIALIQVCHESDSGVTVETLFVHESGETLSAGKLHVPASKQDPQGYGSALTYARRYSVMSACGIAPEDDDGNASSKGKPGERNANGTLKGPGVISATKSAFDSLPPDWQAWVSDFATDLANTCEGSGPRAAKELLVKATVDNDLQAEHIAAIWSKLDSKSRSQIDALTKKAA